MHNQEAEHGDIDELLAELTSFEEVNPADHEQLKQVLLQQDTIQTDPQLMQEQPSAPGMINQTALAQLGLPEKIKLAMFGNETCRAFLIRDPNRLVSHFVLKNPRMQLREIEEFAKNPNLSEQVLRTIAGNSSWIKSYSLKYSIATNPKTPSDVALKWLRYLNLTDLKKISKSKNLPNVVVVAARKKVADGEQG